MTRPMLDQSLWIYPTKFSNACKFSYDSSTRLKSGRKMLSDCGMWHVFYDAKLVIPLPDAKRSCHYCKTGASVRADVQIAKRNWKPVSFESPRF
jgi:hypothetical protein